MPLDIWIPSDYLDINTLRGRAVLDLLGRARHPGPRTVVDLGCGPGNNTEVIARHWPDALVIGIDNSPSMIAAAREREQPGRLEFLVGDLATWQPAGPVDVVLLNAVLQWLPEHPALLPRLAGMLAPGGVLGFQMPGNIPGRPSVLVDIARDLTREPRWRDKLGSAYHSGELLDPLGYMTVLGDAGLRPEAWCTTYTYLLPGDGRRLVEYASGSVLRPALARLAPAEQEEFLGEYGQRLREANPLRVIGGEPVEVLCQDRVFAIGWVPPASG